MFNPQGTRSLEAVESPQHRVWREEVERRADLFLVENFPALTGTAQDLPELASNPEVSHLESVCNLRLTEGTQVESPVR
jgi:hypothetical protein